MKAGHFIVVEGLEGAGKSTAINTIKDFFTLNKIPYITTREPGGTKVGELARKIIKETESNEILDPRTELLLLYAARIQLLENIIKPALRKGTWVLSDRFELSTWAYQGGGRKIDRKIIQQLSTLCLKDFEPDLIIFLDILPELGLKRVARRSQTDRIEQESLAFFQDVYNAYQEHLKSLKNVVKIDASQPLILVQTEIKKHLQTYFDSK